MATAGVFLSPVLPLIFFWSITGFGIPTLSSIFFFDFQAFFFSIRATADTLMTRFIYKRIIYLFRISCESAIRLGLSGYKIKSKITIFDFRFSDFGKCRAVLVSSWVLWGIYHAMPTLGGDGIFFPENRPSKFSIFDSVESKKIAIFFSDSILIFNTTYQVDRTTFNF